MRLRDFVPGWLMPKAAPAMPVREDRQGWFPLVREPFTGAWQRNISVDRTTALAFHAVFACLTLIASDVSKLRVCLKEQNTTTGIWSETSSPAFSPVLKKPNRFQNRIQFWESWILSKLSRGNTYVLKERDARGVVVALYVLDPNRVKALVADDGEVFYQLNADNISGLGAELTVPASEIIHDRFNCLFHPLVGVSPLYAAGLAACQGTAIQNTSTSFFAKASRPSGLVVAPGNLEPEDAKRIKEAFESGFTGENAGRIAVVGNGLKFEALTITAHDAQLIEQLKWDAEVVASTFHVPPYKIGVGEMPKFTNVQALNVDYYSQCLQVLIEAAELCLDEGLGLDAVTGKTYGAEFDTDNLLRMDSVTQMDVLDKGKNIMTPDEARAKLDLAPVPGGDAVYRQQQDYSLAALAKRDAQDDPFGKAAPAAAAAPAANENDPAAEAAAAKLATYQTLDALRRALR